MSQTSRFPSLVAAVMAAVLCLQFGATSRIFAGADPGFSFYGYSTIIPDPNPAIVDENTHITVSVRNEGDEPAENVSVKLSFNDWGVTFQGWQEIDTVTIPSILAGGTAVAEFDYVFENRAHTCLEALIVSADEDEDLNDNRCQINLEVVNAGESFGINVPIVNNGDGDLVLLVQGRCLQDPAGEVFGRCEPFEQEVEVPAGEEVLVPVRVEFSPDTPRGTPIEIEVNAFDLANPGDVNAQNHVIVQAVYNTPRGLMEDCLATLAALCDLPSPGKSGKSKGKENKLDEIASHIDKALADEAWVDESRLQMDQRAANRVYGQTAVAVQQLIKLTESKHLPLECKIALNHCARELTDAARILLQTVIRDVGGSVEASALLQEGDRLRLAGNEKKAVKSYHRGHVTVLK